MTSASCPVIRASAASNVDASEVSAGGESVTGGPLRPGGPREGGPLRPGGPRLGGPRFFGGAFSTTSGSGSDSGSGSGSELCGSEDGGLLVGDPDGGPFGGPLGGPEGGPFVGLRPGGPREGGPRGGGPREGGPRGVSSTSSSSSSEVSGGAMPPQGLRLPIKLIQKQGEIPNSLQPLP